MTRLGLIGTGLMGSAMVCRLRALGQPITIWNREPGAIPPLAALGATPAASPRAVAEVADLVLLCVLDTPAVEQVVWGPHGVAAAAPAPRLLIDLSTIDPAATRRFAARLHAETGTAWIDAPVSGGPASAEAGTLALMAGGDPADLDHARPTLAHLAANITYMGPVGAGQTTKLVNQALVGAGFVLMAEAAAMARAAGIEAERLPACLQGGLADSALLQVVYPAMQARIFEPKLAYARQLDKDMRAVHAFAQAHGLDLPLVQAAVDRYAAFIAQGHGMEDSRAIARMYDRAQEPAKEPPTRETPP